MRQSLSRCPAAEAPSSPAQGGCPSPRLLQRFIKSAAGERASDLRVSLSGGSLLLTNLELNLDALVGRLPLRVERAYARQLRVTVPWTALATQPIQARGSA